LAQLKYEFDGEAARLHRARQRERLVNGIEFKVSLRLLQRIGRRGMTFAPFQPPVEPGQHEVAHRIVSAAHSCGAPLGAKRAGDPERELIVGIAVERALEQAESREALLALLPVVGQAHRANAARPAPVIRRRVVPASNA